MKTLEKQFTKNGFQFDQERRQGSVALYRKSKPHWKSEHYEVVLVLRHNGMELAGNWIPPAEYFPSSEQWGTKGFSFVDREEALAKFYDLVEAERREQ